MDIQEFIVDRDQHMRPLEYDLSENFNALLRYMQDIGILDNVPVGVTSESEVVSISDSYPAPPRALNVYGKSTQAGTPTPDVPVPILSVDELGLQLQNGPNMLDTSAWVEGKYIGPNGAIGSESGIHYTENYSRVMPGTYVFNMHRSSTATSVVRLHGYDKDFRWVRQLYSEAVNTGNSWYTETGIVIDSDVKYVRVSCHSTMTELQLELGSAATEYEPYVGTTVPDLLPEGTDLRSLPDGTKDTLSLSYLRPSTRAGWAWYSREVTRAVGHVADMGELAWNTFTYSGTLLMYANIADMIEAQSGITTFLCSGYVAQASKTINELVSMPDLNCAPRNTYKQVYVKDSNYTDAGAFKDAVEGMTLLYQLATPVTTQLDPIELPQLPAPNATVWCDGGNAQPTLTLEYVRDANAALADLSEAIADIVSG